MAKAEKEKTTAELMADLEKKYGKGTVQTNKESFDRPLGVISTGSPRLDRATGIGGVPVGRITEIVAPESAGKTTVATHICAEAQIKFPDRKVLILDIEHTFDFKYAQQIGLNPYLVTFCQPGYGEMAFDIAKTLIKTGEYSVCIFDSVAAAIPKEQHDGETGQSRMARLAAMMSMETPKLVPIIHDAGTAMIFLNQFRNNIGGYGNPEKPAGGEALKYYCSMMIDIRKTAEKDNHRNETRAKIFKNKCAPPHGEATFYIDWGIGINRTMDIFNDAIDIGEIKIAGSWYTLWPGASGEHRAQGEDAMVKFLTDNPEMTAQLEDNIIGKLAVI